MEHQTPASRNERISKGTAIQFVILLGVVSLLADITYEGARSITGPYLAALGASATIVGIVAGFGELIGFGVRLISGYMSDRTGKYWAIALFGYFLNMLAVPLLALTGHWETAAVLMITERLGKAIRSPARDAMLSHATKETGRGWGFGLHEAMDQIGAMLGPLIVTAVLYFKGSYGIASYRIAFGILIVPALLALGVIGAARILYPKPRDLEISTPELDTQGLNRTFWIYLSAVALIAAGYVDFPLIAYHLKKTAVIPAIWIPVFYSIAMGIDALAALVFGRLFDRIGIPVLVIASVLSTLFAPLVFLGNFSFALAGMVLWGIGMGAQESIMRAAIAEMVPANRRGSAYGVFNTGYGVAWFLGSACMGFLYDISIFSLILFSVVMQVASIPLLLACNREKQAQRS